MPDWLSPFFIFFPAYALFFAGVGIPWALVLLPRDEWRNPVMVVALGLALGPILSTTWLFRLGYKDQFLPERALAGILMLMVLGITGAWLRRHTSYRATHLRPEPWTGFEKLTLLLIGLAFITHIWNTMFWTFAQYDTLWTFAYNPRVYLLQKLIPYWVGYYPQLIPLTYTYGQLLNGEINDHVARAAIPWFFFSSILMAYVLGWRVWGKRAIGIYTAALWALMPNALYWSNAGDLEHPMTLYFTGALVFFILAWRSHHPRYAIISGLLFGGALWTKPTAGAFGLGVILVMLLMTLRLLMPVALRERLGLPNVSQARRTFGQKLGLCILTALACYPIGSMWYWRNRHTGHEVITFPDDFWNDLAQRSAQELGWLILFLLLAVPLMTLRYKLSRQNLLLLWSGLALFLLGTLPNALAWNRAWRRESLWDWVMGARPPSGRLSFLEVVLILLGLALILMASRGLWQKANERIRSSVFLIGVLILPFTLVWFWDYSYHYRLMLSITPALASFVAVLLEAWVFPALEAKPLRRRVGAGLLIALAGCALFLASWFTIWGTFVQPLRTDEEKYAAANPALMAGVNKIREIREETGRNQLYIYTFGDMRYNFFFPEMHSIWREWFVTSLDDLFNPTDFLVAGTHADFYWNEYGLYPNQVSAYMDVGFHYSLDHIQFREGSIFRLPLEPVLFEDDGNNQVIGFRYYPTVRKYSLEEINPPFQWEAGHWEFLALRGLEVRYEWEGDSLPLLPDASGKIPVHGGQKIQLQLYWQRSSPTPPPFDYVVYVHLIDPASGEVVGQRDAPLMDGLMPLTLMAYPDLLPDRRNWQLPDELPTGDLALKIGLFHPITGERAILSDGTDGIWLPEVLYSPE